MSSPSVTVQVHGRTALVVVRGDFDAAGSAQAVAVFTGAVGGSQLDAVEVDMSEAGFVDSSGLGALIRLRQEARLRGARTTLTGLDPRLRRLLQITGVAEDFFTRIDDPSSDRSQSDAR